MRICIEAKGGQSPPQTNNPLSFFPDFAWRNVVVLTSEQSSSATWLDNLLARWRQWLQACANDGSLVAAAVEALQLPGETEPLRAWLGGLRRGDEQALPAVVVLPAAAMNGALGAYAGSQGTIVLNGDWLPTAADAAVQQVLTEELGHHLDAVLNSRDTPGDEGELFAMLLGGQGLNGNEDAINRLRNEDDQGTVVIANETVAVEQATDTTAPTITGLLLPNTIVNPTQPGGAYLSARLSFSDDSSGFSYAGLNFKSQDAPNGRSVSISLGNYDLTEGTSMSGTVSGGVMLEAYGLTNGTWKLSSISIGDKSGNNLFISDYQSDWSSFLKSSNITQTSFVISGSQPDTKPPVIKGLSINNPKIDRTSGGKYLSGVLDFADDISGFNYLGLDYGVGRIYIYPGGSSITSRSGSSLAGQISWSAGFDPSTSIPEGVLTLKSITIIDRAGNSFYKYFLDSTWSSYLTEIGLTPTVTISGSPLAEPIEPSAKPPVAIGFSMPRTVFNPSQPGGDFLNANLSYQHNSNRLSGYLNFTNAAHPSANYSVGLSSSAGGEAQTPDGFISGVLHTDDRLSPWMATGEWTLSSLSLSGNNSSIYHSIDDPDWLNFLESSAISTTSFRVEASPGHPLDDAAPSLRGITISDTVVRGYQDSALSAVIDFQDDRSGLQYAYLSYVSETGEDIIDFGGGPRNYLIGTALNGQITVPSYQRSNTIGDFNLQFVHLVDQAENYFDIDSTDPDWDAFLARSGITQTTITRVASGDTLPAVSLTLSPTTVTEDGSTNLVYTFTRTGPTTTPLTINYLVSGTASIGDFNGSGAIGGDFTGIEVTSTLKELTFAAGSSTATVTVDPTPDPLNEPDETVILTIPDPIVGALFPGWVGSNYTLGTPSSATGVIINAAPPTPLKSTTKVVNGVALLQDSSSQRYLVAIGTAAPVEISYGPGSPGLPVTDTTFAGAGFQLLAAARLNGSNTLLWRHQPSNQLLTWTLDDNGHQLGGSGLLPITGAEALRLERQFQLDLDGNQIVGAPEATLRGRSTDTSPGLLRRNGSRLALVGTSGGTIQLTWGGAPINENDTRLAGWSAVAAARINGVNSLLWKRSGSGELSTWSFDGLWAATGGTPPVAPTSPQALDDERNFGLDLNGDRSVGSTRLLVARSSGLGGEGLYRDALSRGLSTSAGTPLLWGGVALQDNDARLPGWKAVAIRSLGGGSLLWRQDASGALATWTFDSTWNATGGTASVAPTTAEAYNLEITYNLDANGDRSIGNPYGTIALAVNTLGNSSNRWALLRHSRNNGLAVSLNNGQPLPLSWGGLALLDGDSRTAGWTAIAATSEGSLNKLLWRQEGSGNLATWTFEATWAAVAGSPAVAPSSSDAYALERSFGIDANRDGTIGSPTAAAAVISSVGTVTLQRSLSGNRLSVVDNGSVPVDLMWGGSVVTAPDPRLAGWTPIAAARANGTNSLLWRQTGTNQLAQWTLDASWRATGGTAPVAADSAIAYGYETSYGLDLNGDRSIGVPFVTIATNDGIPYGYTSLVRLLSSRQLAISRDSNALTPLTWGGAALLDGDSRLSGWSALAVTPANTALATKLLWQQAGTGNLASWTFDPKGTAISGTSPVAPASPEAYQLEQTFGLDLDADRTIGNPFTTIAITGAVALQRHSRSGRLAVSSGGGPAMGLSWGGSELLDGDPRLSGWTAIAAARVNDTNQLLWQQAGSRSLVTWTFDANWNPTGGTAPVDSNSLQALNLETSFAVDLNGDRFLGEPQSPLEQLRGLIQARSATANAASPFSSIATGGAGADLLTAPSTGNALLSGFDFVTGLGLPAGAIDLLDGATGTARVTYGLWSPTDQPFAADGDSGYTLIRHYRAGTDDLVVSNTLPLSTAQRTVAGPGGTTVTGLGLHIDTNTNGVFDAGDNLIALLEGISTLPTRCLTI